MTFINELSLTIVPGSHRESNPNPPRVGYGLSPQRKTVGNYLNTQKKAYFDSV